MIKYFLLEKRNERYESVNKKFTREFKITNLIIFHVNYSNSQKTMPKIPRGCAK